MRTKGRHRRPRSTSLHRALVAAGAGGAALVVPVIGAPAAGAVPAQSLHTEKAAAPTTAPVRAYRAAPTTTIYSVAAGDSLSGIAQELSLPGGWKKLHQDNRKTVGEDPSLIHPGLKLTIGKKARTAAPTGRADRSERRTAPSTTSAAPETAKAATYSNDLDGWIRESLDVMSQRGIPGTYEGIRRNIIRESAGNPLAINNWDSNAASGTPSKGLLQVIDPTFLAYHVPGTSTDSYDPVANITAACNYAADKYGSIDNVNGAY
ncbi:LysM peptidoglycan-binding domain-containing protein [Streptomyces sp. H27-C3]|uniref:transglycosylase SLT domain-containing protein n=1 Tax=Streptomyces sp. H27-C3 TaxID=3046305 RepID=UPI0024B97CD6|nr:LysM peptidoglycan-binding domain-containing protein [Streptomyces sp. H27-C3]MDJ0466941.1 LysM peptidoglycan-binding domain-containing protein [Streptomyces sp. H27-C3]